MAITNPDIPLTRNLTLQRDSLAIEIQGGGPWRVYAPGSSLPIPAMHADVISALLSYLPPPGGNRAAESRIDLANVTCISMLEQGKILVGKVFEPRDAELLIQPYIEPERNIQTGDFNWASMRDKRAEWEASWAPVLVRRESETPGMNVLPAHPDDTIVVYRIRARLPQRTWQAPLSVQRGGFIPAGPQVRVIPGTHLSRESARACLLPGNIQFSGRVCWGTGGDLFGIQPVLSLADLDRLLWGSVFNQDYQDYARWSQPLEHWVTRAGKSMERVRELGRLPAAALIQRI